MLHDNFDDILVRPDLFPTFAAKRAAILKIRPCGRISQAEAWLAERLVPERWSQTS